MLYYNLLKIRRR